MYWDVGVATARIKCSMHLLWRQIGKELCLEPMFFLQRFLVQAHMLHLETEAHWAGRTVPHTSVPGKSMWDLTGKSCGKRIFSGHCPSRGLLLGCSSHLYCLSGQVWCRDTQDTTAPFPAPHTPSQGHREALSRAQYLPVIPLLLPALSLSENSNTGRST